MTAVIFFYYLCNIMRFFLKLYDYEKTVLDDSINGAYARIRTGI
jgi:hypothetical protein